MISQVDSEGYPYQVIKDISDHSTDGSALKKSDVFIRIHGRNLHAKKTTRGWKLEFEWKDGTLIWIPLQDIKSSNTVELAEYAVFLQGVLTLMYFCASLVLEMPTFLG